MSDLITEDYRPSEDEPYMNDRQLEYFRNKLMSWREEILRGSSETLKQLKEEDNRPRRHERLGVLRDRAQLSVAGAGPRTQASFENCCRHRTDRGWFLRLLRGKPGADRSSASGSASYRDAQYRGPRTSRAPRESLPRRVTRNTLRCSLRTGVCTKNERSDRAISVQLAVLTFTSCKRAWTSTANGWLVCAPRPVQARPALTLARCSAEGSVSP